MFKRQYHMLERDFGVQGSLFTFQHNYCKLDVLTAVLISILPICLLLCSKGRPPENIDVSVIASLLWFIGAIVIHLNRVIFESILIVSSIGVTVKTSKYISSEIRYFDIKNIEDIVIVEAISMHSVHCQMVLLPKVGEEEKRNKKKYKHKVIPLFLTFKPGLEDLKSIYRQVQKKLILPHQQMADR